MGPNEPVPSVNGKQTQEKHTREDRIAHGDTTISGPEYLQCALLVAMALATADSRENTTSSHEEQQGARVARSQPDVASLVTTLLSKGVDTVGSGLVPIQPREAVARYLDHRRDDARQATRRKHASALHIFIEWTDEAEIENLNDLQGRQLLEFKTWRKTQTELSTISLNGNLAILRRFLTFCETIEAVPAGLADRVPLPNVPPEEEISNVVPDDAEVAAIREYYQTFEYASRRQAQFELIAEVGLRLGAVRAIDLEDVDADGRVIHLWHRPEGPDEYGTPLKNGTDGERIINLSASLCELLADYIDHTRHDVVDRYDRKPLFTTAQGRVTTATIRRDFYKLTRPCVYTGDCPHGREITTCPATQNSHAVECPSRFSTHPLRRWSIMHQLDAGVPKELLSDRVDVSVPVLDKHYDQRSEARKSRQRRTALETSLDEYMNP